MSEIKVSQMQEATNVNDDDYLMIVQNGINKKTKARNVGTGGNVAGDTLPVGSVIEWNSDIIPVNWLLCNGQEISRTDYADLFKILGTKYGQGDGSTTFNLPNRKGNVAVGKDENDEDFNELGKTGGEKEHTLTVAEMPSHNHEPTTNSAVMAKSGQNEMAQETTGGRTYELLTIGKTGGSQPHNNLQPYIVSNFIIKAKQSAGLVATVVDNLESESETDALSAKQGKALNENKQDKNLIKTFHLENDNTEFIVDGLDITRDGGTYEVEMYLQHSKAGDFAIGIQINNSDDAKWVYQGLDCLNDGNPACITSYNTTPNYGRLGAIRYNYTTIIKMTIHKAEYSFGGSLRYYVESMCMNGNFFERTISQYWPDDVATNLTSFRILNVSNTEVFQNGSYVKIYKK